MKRWQSLALGLVISLATLAYAVNGVDFNALRDEFARGHYLWLLPALGILIAGLLFRSLRWRALLNGQINLQHSFNILNAGYFLGAVLPFRLGEVVRAYLTTRLKPPISVFTSLSSMVVERLTDMLAVVVLTVIAISLAPATPQVESAARITGVLAVSGLVVLAVLAARRDLAHHLMGTVLHIIPALQRFDLTHMVDRVLDGIAPLGSVRGIANTLFWTVLAWSASIAEGYVLMPVFYDKPDLNSTLLMIVLASLAVAIPAVPGSVGPFEAAIVSGLAIGGLAGTPELRARALAYAVVLHVINTGMYAFLGWIGLSQEQISLTQIVQSAQALTRRKRTDAPDTPDAVMP